MRESNIRSLEHQPQLFPTSSQPTKTSVGTLYGIGVGPGDPELITVKALQILKKSPVVAFPSGINQNPGVAERTITPWLSAKQIRLPLTFPYVQDSQALEMAWQQAAQTIWPYLQQGDVVFACEGDVSFYSTFTYLADRLHQQHPDAQIEAIAGVSSPMAAAAALGIPLTCQAQKLTILPALYTVEQLESVLSDADVVVLMKVSSVYSQVWRILEKHQLLDRSYVVVNATKQDQITYSGLKGHPELQLPYFSLLLVKVSC
ncbi:MAG: precorrin-2 C(20)-methyltransferase [Cyanobacteria bacterium J06632_3]